MAIKFGTDGVRGVANKELTPEIAFKLGRCGGYVLQKHSEEKHPLVLVGRDSRISGYMLETALTSGLLSVGIEVMHLGVIPTPAVAYLTKNQGAVAGVMISASHNPVRDNGIKFFGSDGYKLSDEQELEIEELVNQEVDNLPRPSDEGLGQLDYYPEGSLRYAEFLIDTASSDLSGLRVCVDSANGATTPLVHRVFADLDTDFYTMADRPNGLNINDNVGSTHPEALQAFVLEKEADIGVAFDGDGDRVIAVDELGQIVDGDKILYICGKHLASKGRLHENTVVSTVMSNLGFHRSLEREGLKSVTTPVGDRYVVEKMREGNYNLGGEQSGHIIFSDYSTTGDGMLVAIQLMQVMVETGKKLSELASEVDIYPQLLVNVEVKPEDKEKVLEHPEVEKVASEVEESLGETGRLLIRPSGTEPLFRVMVEAESEDKVARSVDKVVQVVKDLFGV